ncbi:glycosyltransferase [Paenibacillus sp. LjRoot56]|uniref:glycosyltransferase n=1 Tax=Paenibacillus sp. LjRoot56 TaxID=3342333 RepID=UPI003ED0218A
MQVSVIMAVYNRAPLLPALLEHWREVNKVTKYSYELIFSDDASNDDSVNILENCNFLPIKVLRNKHGGAAKARNHAYQYATGEIILFTGDDIFPTPNFLNEHYESYLKNGKMHATLGRIDWREGIQMNHLMTHITDIGCEQFGFVGMKPYDIVDFRHFYTSNISVYREHLIQLGYLFNEDFKKCNFEDIELGYRLSKIGVNIYYNPNALAHHDHVYSSVDKYCKRQFTAGEELNTFKRIQPGLTSDEIKVDIDEFNGKYAKYVSSNRNIDVVGDAGRLMIYIFKQLTKLFEKVLLKADSHLIRKICSRMYAIVFSYYMYLGLAFGYDNAKFTKQAKRYVFRYLYFGKSQLFFDKNNDFTEINSIQFHTVGERTVTLHLDMRNRQIGKLRFDPLNNFCEIKLNYASAYLENGKIKEIEFIFTNGKTNNGNQYDFSNEIDPILISDYLPKDTKSVEIQFQINYLLTKHTWNYLKTICNKITPLIKKSMKYLVKASKKNNDTQIITTSTQEKKRKVWITIKEYNLKKSISSLVQEYQDICSIFPDIQIQSSDCTSMEYEEYVYEILDSSRALEKTQFLNAVLTILQYDYDFVIVSDNLEYFPSVYAFTVQESTIFAKKLVSFEKFQNSLDEYTGIFIKIPGSRQLSNIIDISDQLKEIKTLDGKVLYSHQPKEINWYNQIEVITLEKQKPIVFIFPAFMAVGGVERNTVEVMSRLKSEFDFVVITFESLRPEQGSLFYQITDLCLSYYDLSEISTFDKYLNLLEKFKRAYNPDLVWICNSSPWSMEKAADIRRIYSDIPVVAQDVYDYKYGWIEYYDRPAIRSYDRFIAINKKIENKFVTTYGINSEDIDLVYPATDMDNINKLTTGNYSRVDVLKDHNLNPDKLHFAFIGRFTEQKQPKKVFELAKYIINTYENVDFVMVGDGELSPEIELLIEKYDLQSRIHRIKYIANVPEFTKSMNGLVIASIFEGLPIVTIEAMCVGTPIFSTDVGDVALFVKQFNIGIITENHEIDTIKKEFDTFFVNLDLYKKNTEQSIEINMHFFSSLRAAELMKDSFYKAISKYQAKAVVQKGWVET